MESEEQIALIVELDRLIRQISNAGERKEIMALGKEVLLLSKNVPPFVHPNINSPDYAISCKAMIMRLIAGDLHAIDDETNTDWKTVHYQINVSIGMLMLNFVHGGVERAGQIIADKARK